MRLLTKDIITKDECLTSEEVKSYIKDFRVRYYVYFLVDPFSFQIKYVGKGSGHRCLDHFEIDLISNKRKQSWLNKLAKRNKEPLYVIWEFYDNEDLAYEQEKNFIYMFGRVDKDRRGLLLNKSKGGRAGSGRWVNTSDFIERASNLHKGLYVYDKVFYTRTIDKVEIYCTKCKKYFLQSPNDHLKGNGCQVCAKEFQKTVRLLSTEQVIDDFDKVHRGAYDYSLVVYKNATTKVSIKCKRCSNIFEQRPSAHKQGQGCPNCKDCSNHRFR